MVFSDHRKMWCFFYNYCMNKDHAFNYQYFLIWKTSALWKDVIYDLLSFFEDYVVLVKWGHFILRKENDVGRLSGQVQKVMYLIALLRDNLLIQLLLLYLQYLVNSFLCLPVYSFFYPVTPCPTFSMLAIVLSPSLDSLCSPFGISQTMLV